MLKSLKEKEGQNLIIDISDEVLDNLSMIYITPKGGNADSAYSTVKSSDFKDHPISHIMWSKRDQVAALKNKNEQNQKTSNEDYIVEDLSEEEALLNADLEKKYNHLSVETILDKIINNAFDIRNEIIPEYTKQTLQSCSKFI